MSQPDPGARAHIRTFLEMQAAEKGAALSQLAIAWLLARRDHIVPIPGSRNPGRVAENVASADLVLTEADLARIDELAPTGGFAGRA